MANYNYFSDCCGAPLWGIDGLQLFQCSHCKQILDEFNQPVEEDILPGLA